jgi:hypothetical protein
VPVDRELERAKHSELHAIAPSKVEYRLLYRKT